MHHGDTAASSIGDPDAPLSAAVRRELEQQLQKDKVYREKVEAQRADLNSLLREVGKVPLRDRPLLEGGGGGGGSESEAGWNLNGNGGGGEEEGVERRRTPLPQEHCGLARELQALRRRVEGLEAENNLRKLEVNVLRRVLLDADVCVPACHKEVLAVIAASATFASPLASFDMEAAAKQQRRLQQGTPDVDVADKEAARMAAQNAMARLTETSLAAFVKAAYTEPSILSTMDGLPEI